MLKSLKMLIWIWFVQKVTENVQKLKGTKEIISSAETMCSVSLIFLSYLNLFLQHLQNQFLDLGFELNEEHRKWYHNKQ